MQAAFSKTAGQGKSFAKAKDRSPAPAWDRGNLEEWRATLSKQRREEDLAKLSRIFNLAAKVPELRDALEWAKDHGIDFIVDHTANAYGYYTARTGVVAMSGKAFADDRLAAGTLVHEIRHAWQECHGMLATTSSSFTDYFIRTAILEADATAHEQLAQFQHGLAHNIDYFSKCADSRRNREILASDRGRLDDSVRTTWRLWDEFQNWYGQRAFVYGGNGMRHFGKVLGIPGVEAPALNAEYQPYKDRKAPVLPGLDILREEQLRRIGRGFTGGHNYFDHAGRDRIFREFLSPGRASTFFNAAGSKGFTSYDRNPMVDEIRCRELLLKRHKAVLL